MEYYLGLDIGTSSVGWALTDKEYNILRLKGKDAWGCREFDEALTTGDDSGYRANRCNRRRLEKSKTREGLLRGFFAEEIDKIDPLFFLRLDNSKLYLEDKDKALKSKNGIFDDENYTDKDYYAQYPTIFHLRKDLLENTNAPYDVRLVYLAIANMYKHRGHFLLNTENDDLDFGGTKAAYESVMNSLEQIYEVEIKQIGFSSAIEVLSDRTLGKRVKGEKLATLLNVDKHKNILEFIKCLCGSQSSTGKLFNTEPEDTANINFSSFSYVDSIPEIQSKISEEDYTIIENMKKVYDYALISSILKGGEYEYLSLARVDMFEKHQKDLRLLKKVYKELLGAQKYDEMFRSNAPSSYSAYVNSTNSNENKHRRNVKQRTSDYLYDRIKKDLKGISGNADVDNIISDIETDSFLPKQLTGANGVIPNQIHAKELRAILSNAEVYLPFLKKIDETGLSISEQIIQLFSFQIPYYVGPTGKNSKNRWAVRKEDGPVLPWNIWDKIDKKKTSEEFIRRMVRTCSYINGETVLPKSSLLYEEYCLLNELNNIRIAGERIESKIKRDIIDDLFRVPNGKRVTRAKLVKYLIGRGIISEDTELTGVDVNINSYLPSYGKMYAIFGEKLATDKCYRCAEDIIYTGTIYGDSKEMFREGIAQYCESGLITKEDVKRIIGYKFKDWGRISEAMLKLTGCDKSTGEEVTLINAMREYSLNFMELINSNDFTFKQALEAKSINSFKSLAEFKYEDLDEYYFSAPVKRMIWQTIQIIDEVSRIVGNEPQKIFIEMTRSKEERPVRKESRGKQLIEFYKAIKGEEKNWQTDIKNYDESGDLKSKKLYLYYLQMGKDMYTGENIELSELFTTKYDIDHIYPRSIAGKDDSIISNLVLVNKDYNARVKADKYPIPSQISKNPKVRELWNYLHSIKTANGQRLLSDEKFNRLTRTSRLTDEELASFISRQLVETSQATKSVGNILKQVLPMTTIVYSKASNVSDFRKNYGYLKSRLLNEFHHAQDAYLNIVVGNVYCTKFTQNPRIFIDKEYNKDRNRNHYNLDNKKMFERDVVRGDNVAWAAGEGKSLAIVRKNLNKNTPLITKLSFDTKGAFYNIQPVGKNVAKEDNYAPLKEGLSPEKYGGYSSITPSYFVFIEYTDSKGKVKKGFDSVPVLAAEKYKDNIATYLAVKNGYESVRLICDHIKKESLVNYNGYFLYIAGLDSRKNVEFHNATAMCLPHSMSQYVQKIEKSVENKVLSADITKEMNCELYKCLSEKHNSGVFRNYPRAFGKELSSSYGIFENMKLNEQTELLYKIVSITSFSKGTYDMSSLGAPKDLGRIRISIDANKATKLSIINKSITGLYEKEIDLLKN